MLLSVRAKLAESGKSLSSFSTLWANPESRRMQLVTVRRSVHEKGKEWQLALALLTTMAQSRVTGDVISCSAAICSCEKGGEWQLALDLLGSMAHSNVEANTITYNSAISACEKWEEWELALVLFSNMMESKMGRDTLGHGGGIVEYSSKHQMTKVLM